MENSIQKLRIKQGVAQEYIATNMNVSVATVSRWESGEFLPRADKLLQLAKLLHCTVDDLLKQS